MTTTECHVHIELTTLTSSKPCTHHLPSQPYLRLIKVVHLAIYTIQIQRIKKKATRNIITIHHPFDAHFCHMGTAVKHTVPDWVKPSFVIFDIRAF